MFDRLSSTKYMMKLLACCASSWPPPFLDSTSWHFSSDPTPLIFKFVVQITISSFLVLILPYQHSCSTSSSLSVSSITSACHLTAFYGTPTFSCLVIWLCLSNFIKISHRPWCASAVSSQPSHSPCASIQPFFWYFHLECYIFYWSCLQFSGVKPAS